MSVGWLEVEDGGWVVDLGLGGCDLSVVWAVYLGDFVSHQTKGGHVGHVESETLNWDPMA